MFETTIENGTLKITFQDEDDMDLEAESDEDLTNVDNIDLDTLNESIKSSLHTIEFNQLKRLENLLPIINVCPRTSLKSIVFFYLYHELPSANTIATATAFLAETLPAHNFIFEQCWIDASFINTLLDKLINRMSPTGTQLTSTSSSAFFTSTTSETLKFIFELPIFSNYLNADSFLQKVIRLLPAMNTFKCIFLIKENNAPDDTTYFNLKSFTQALIFCGANLRHLELNYLFLDSVTDIIEFIRSPNCKLETLDLTLNSADGSLDKLSELLSAISKNPHLTSVKIQTHSLSDTPDLSSIDLTNIINRYKSSLPTFHFALREINLLGSTLDVLPIPPDTLTNEPKQKKQKLG